MPSSSQSTYIRATKWLLLLLLVMASLVAAFVHRPFRTVSYSELLQAAEPNYQNTLITTTVYCGSRDGFDYFIVRPVAGLEKRYQVSTANSAAVLNRFAYTSEAGRWVNCDFNFVLRGMVTLKTNQVVSGQP